MIKKFDLSDCDSEHLLVITMCGDNDGNISKVALAMLRSYLRANHGEADYSTARILRFFIICQRGKIYENSMKDF